MNLCFFRHMFPMERHGSALRIEPKAEFAAGELIGGRYRLVRELGKGAFSSVLLAEDIVRGGDVAVKSLHGSYRGSERVLKMLEIEAKALSMVNHDSIVRLLGKGEDFLVLERLEGHPASSFRYDATGVLSLASEACEALYAVHRRGIVHRDLKPAHMMVSHGTLKLIDFGYSMIRGEWDYSKVAGHDIGTAAYMAPEQTKHAWELDHRADIYSLGVIMYEKLAGFLPFEDEDWKRVAMMHRYDAPEPLRDVHPAAAAIVQKALAKKPDDRFSDALEMKAAIDKALNL
jgi:serine/threonine protein kinase